MRLTQFHELIEAQFGAVRGASVVVVVASVVAGASVVSFGGKPAGTLSKVDLAADSITLDSPDGPVLLTKEYFTVTPEGRLMALVTREQIASAAASRTAGGGAQ